MIGEHTQHIAVLSVRIHIPEAQSLKEKRMTVRSLKDRIRSRFNVSFAELDGHDKWQLATCDMVMIGKDRPYIDRCLNNIVSEIRQKRSIELLDHHVEYL